MDRRDLSQTFQLQEISPEILNFATTDPEVVNRTFLFYEKYLLVLSVKSFSRDYSDLLIESITNRLKSFFSSQEVTFSLDSLFLADKIITTLEIFFSHNRSSPLNLALFFFRGEEAVVVADESVEVPSFFPSPSSTNQVREEDLTVNIYSFLLPRGFSQISWGYPPSSTLSFRYDPESDYSRYQLGENEGFPGSFEEEEECAKRLSGEVYRLDPEGGRIYYYKDKFDQFPRGCGRISHDSLLDCQMPSLVPRERLGELYRGAKKVEVETLPPYYCRRQLTRDNPDLEIDSKSRVLKGSALASLPGMRKKEFISDICLGGKADCKEYYDPKDFAYYKKSSYETPFKLGSKLEDYALLSELDGETTSRYISIIKNDLGVLYYQLAQGLFENKNPEISVVIFSGKENLRIVQRQEVTELTHLYIFYYVPNFGFDSGHGTIAIADTDTLAVSYVDSYNLGKYPTYIVKDFFETLISEDEEILKSTKERFNRGWIETAEYYEKYDKISPRLEIYQNAKEKLERGGKISNFAKCPLNNKKVLPGIQHYSSHGEELCFLWALFIADLIVKKYQEITSLVEESRRRGRKSPEKHYLNIEKDINAAVIARGGVARTIVSFVMHQIGQRINLDMKFQPDSVMSNVAYQMWSYNPEVFLSVMQTYFPEKRAETWQNFFEPPPVVPSHSVRTPSVRSSRRGRR